MCRIAAVGMMLALVAACVAPAYGQEVAEAQPGAAQVTEAPAPQVSIGKALGLIGACIGAALSVGGGGYGIARIGSACIESIARQPEAGGAMFAPMVVAAAMVEGGMLFAIVVCLMAILGLG